MSSSEHPSGGDGSRRRRNFTAEDKLRYVAAYEKACETGEGGAYLRREGLYSSSISEWRQLRDAGVLAGDDAAGPRAVRRSGLTASSPTSSRSPSRRSPPRAPCGVPTADPEPAYPHRPLGPLRAFSVVT
ncbi:MAG: hypothetical protein INR66_20575 [Gordonia polyisoprenivorans]|nr:hypothetical protein [Gordonia polyisoprenivorans]